MASAAVATYVTNMDTYQILRRSRTAILALDAMLLLAIVIGAQVHRDAMRTVGKDAAPSIVSAQHIKAAMADLDADEANELLAPPNTANSATAGAVARQEESDQALLSAAGNVTFEAERAPIATLQETGELYNRLVQQAEDLRDAQAPGDKPSAEVVQAYRGDSIVMDGALLPAADELDRVNDEELQKTYHHQGTDSALSSSFVILTGFLAVFALIGMQAFLSRRMHRTINPLLLAATVVTLGLTVYALSAMATEQHQLKIAKEDAFESIHSLWRTRALAYEANAEESRYLLDPAHAGDYEQEFRTETQQLMSLPNGMSLEELVARETAEQKVEGFTGYLADELNNITFPGERAAAIQMLSAYGRYEEVDTKIRQLERAGQHEQAVALCVGSAEGQSDWAFAQFDSALEQTLGINQEAFEAAVDKGLDALGGLGAKVTLGGILSTLELKAVLAAGLIAVLVMLGFAPRIKEYV